MTLAADRAALGVDADDCLQVAGAVEGERR